MESFVERKAQVMAEESQHAEAWMYLSFADDDGFRGGIITKARGIGHAITSLHMRGINPGGEVMGAELPEQMLPPEKFRERLLTKEEIKSFWSDAKSLKEHDADAHGVP